MPRIARSDQPLYQTRSRPVRFPVAFTEPDGSATDLTGATIVARLRWAGTDRALGVQNPEPVSGEIVATGAASLVPENSPGRVNELLVTVTDSQGGMVDYVWPVIGEES